MATKRKTQLEQDRMTDANITRVIDLLSPGPDKKAITKKEACQILGMSYNTARLDKLIEDYKTQQATTKKRREEKRGKPATQDEIQYVISEYFRHNSMEKIADNLYRGTQFVKSILEQYGVPQRNLAYDYFNPQLLPEQSVLERYNIGEKVYSSRYECLANVVAEQWCDKRNCWIYRVWLPHWDKFAYQESYELASLRNFEELGIKL